MYIIYGGLSRINGNQNPYHFNNKNNNNNNISLFYGDNILSIHLSNIWSSNTLRQYNYVQTLYVLPSKIIIWKAQGVPQ